MKSQIRNQERPSRFSNNWTLTSRIFSLIAAVPLMTGCNFRSSQPDVTTEELRSLVEQHLVYLGNGSVENLPQDFADNDVIFLGEQHNVPALHRATEKLVCCLAKQKPVVYACETCYGAHPFLESGSLGEPDPLWPIEAPALIKEFNASHSPDQTVMITALDIEHAIYHSKSKTELFLRHLARRSNSAAATEALEKNILDLHTQDSCKKMDRYLKQLKAEFMKYEDTFSPSDRDEIAFSMELLDASNHYQYARREGFCLNRSNKLKLRNTYFKKTIERALQKAHERNALLLCRVGSHHVTGNLEARYFAEKFPQTRGKVLTVCFVQVNGGSTHAQLSTIKEQKDIDINIKQMMKENTYCYLSLVDLKKNAIGSLEWSNFFKKANKPLCQGLLFVKTDPAPSAPL